MVGAFPARILRFQLNPKGRQMKVASMIVKKQGGWPTRSGHTLVEVAYCGMAWERNF